MISIDALTAELATKHDIDRAAAKAAVETYAGQLNDDETSGDLTDTGAELVRDQFASYYAAPVTMDVTEEN